MSSTIDTWVEQILAGDIRAISRAITAIENHHPDAEEILRRVFPHTGKGYLAGITGGRNSAWELSRSIRRVRLRGERFWATVSGCRATPATPGFSSARWRRAGFWAGWRAQRRR